jgi:hypothetical protein
MLFWQSDFRVFLKFSYAPRNDGHEERAQPGATANGPAGPWLISNVGQKRKYDF